MGHRAARGGWLAVAIAACGAPGLEGPGGRAGPAGTTGSSGAAGPAGDNGASGPAGVRGATGATGSAGAEGAEGLPAYRPLPGLSLEVSAASIAEDGTIELGLVARDGRGVPIPPEQLASLRAGIAALAPVEPEARTEAFTAYVLCAGRPCEERVLSGGRLVEGATVAAGRTVVATLSARAPPGADRHRLHRVTATAERLFDGARLSADAVLDFVPDGTTPAPARALVTTAACARCHGTLDAHGSSPADVARCAACHGDLGTLIHARHAAARFPRDLRECGACHDGPTAALPSMAACGSCHAQTWFGAVAQTPAGKTAHTGGPESSSARCRGCHPAAGGVAGIADVHRDRPPRPSLALAIGAVVERAGEAPSVELIATDRAGAPLTSTASFTRLAAYAAGPIGAYARVVEAVAIGEGARGTLARLGEGRYRLAFAAPLPDLGGGRWAFGLEGARTGGGRGAVNPIAPAEAAQVSVADGACASCHGELSAHGGVRAGALAYCAFCHNRDATDAATRPAGAGPPRSLDLPALVHRIHMGAALPSVAEGEPNDAYTAGGAHRDFEPIRFPGGPAACARCHAAAPLPASTRACTSCHDDTPTRLHTAANTIPGGTETCTICHGPARALSAAAVHEGRAE